MNKIKILFEFGKSNNIICSKKYICSLENNIKIYNINNGELVDIFSEIKKPNYAYFLHEDFLIAKNVFGEYYIYDLKNFSLVRKIKIDNFSQPQDSNFILTNDGKYIISSIYDFPIHKLLFYSIPNQDFVLIDFPKIKNPRFLKNDDKYFCVGAYPNTNGFGLDIFYNNIYYNNDKLNICEPKYICTHQGFSHPIIYKNNLIANVFRENLLYDFKTNNKKIVPYLSESNPVYSLDISKNGKYFALAQLTEVLIFSTQELKIVNNIRTSYAYAVKFLESETQLLIGTANKSFCVDLGNMK